MVIEDKSRYMAHRLCDHSYLQSPSGSSHPQSQYGRDYSYLHLTWYTFVTCHTTGILLGRKQILPDSAISMVSSSE